jgi:hypothetical protein
MVPSGWDGDVTRRFMQSAYDVVGMARSFIAVFGKE